MSHFEIDLELDCGVTERIYVKTEKEEKLNLKDIFPADTHIKRWFMREAN